MKKRIFKLPLILVVIAMATLTLMSCGGGNVADKGIAKIVVENGENDYTVYEVDLSKLEERGEGAISLLEYVASQKDSTLYYNVQWGGGYGAYITAIGSLNPDPASEYISVYTSEEKDFAVPTDYAPTVSTVAYGEMTLTYSGVGLSSMSVKDGTVILFRVESFW